MKIRQWIVGIFIFLLAAYPVSAEFYRYVDQHGNVLFTDDLSKVPVEQRDQVKSYEAFEPMPQMEVDKEKEDAQEPEKTSAEKQERQRLQDQQALLNKEYDELMAERARLNEEKSKTVTTAQIKDYNTKITEFNARIQAYEEKREALTREIKAFNDRVNKEESKPEKKQ